MNPLSRSIPTIRFTYWQPGGKTGEVFAITTRGAAQQILGVVDVGYCGGGQPGAGPAVYVGNGSECKIWKPTQSEI